MQKHRHSALALWRYHTVQQNTQLLLDAEASIRENWMLPLVIPRVSLLDAFNPHQPSVSQCWQVYFHQACVERSLPPSSLTKLLLLNTILCTPAFPLLQEAFYPDSGFSPDDRSLVMQCYYMVHHNSISWNLG